MTGRFPKSKLFWANAAALILTGLTFLSAELSSNPSYILVARDVMGIFAIAAAILLGLAFAHSIQRQTTRVARPSVVPAVIFALITLALGWYAYINRNSVYAWSAVALGLGLTLLAVIYVSPGKTPPRALRYVLLVGAFIGGMLPGLVLYLVLAFIVTDRYCQLTNSKCL